MSSEASAPADTAGTRHVDAGGGAAPPPLSFEVVDAHDDKREALRLVTDSIAQQRQIAALAVIFHPLCVAGLLAACAAVWHRSPNDLGTALMSFSGLVMAYLAAAKLYTSPYLAIAEAFDCQSFLAGPDGTLDLVLAARFGHELIGSLVLRLQPSGKLGLVRAWTTRLRYRNKGIGGDLLRFAVAVTRSAAGDDALVVFDPQHANSALPLNRLFHHPFTIRDEKAGKALEREMSDDDAGKRRAFHLVSRNCDQLPTTTDVTTHGPP